MKVLIPGYFSKISSYHSKAISQIIQIVSDLSHSSDIQIIFFIIPQVTYNVQETTEMLMMLKQTYCVITSTSPVIHSTTINENCVNFIINFPDFHFQISKKIKEYSKGQIINDKPVVYNVDFPHPDMELAVHTFLHRQSPRAFQSTPIPKEIINIALTASNRAPTAGNLQSYGITLITTRSILHQVAEAANKQEFIKSSAGVFIFNTEPEISKQKYKEKGARFFTIQDATIACSHLQLALQELGVSSRWVGAFHEKDLLKIIDRDDCGIAGILVFGYPAETRHFSSRRDLSYIKCL